MGQVSPVSALVLGLEGGGDRSRNRTGMSVGVCVVLGFFLVLVSSSGGGVLVEHPTQPEWKAGVQWEEPGVEGKREKVRDAIKFAWAGYVDRAWGWDELRPVSGEGVNNFGGLGATIVDSIGTLFVVGLNDEYRRARDWIADFLDFDKVGDVVVFETVIRILGGLVSTYELTGDNLFLEKAEDLAVRLAPAFRSQSGLPYPVCSLNQSICSFKEASTGALLAEAGSIQLELRALDSHSDKEEIHQIRIKADQVLEVIDAAALPEMHGVLPAKIDILTGKFITNYMTLGAPSDSYFEYLAKLWIQSGYRELNYRDRFLRWVEGMMSFLLRVTPDGEALVFERAGDSIIPKMDHFSCYIPGVLALSVDHLDLSPAHRKLFEEAAVNITATCYQMYAKNNCGLAAEHIRIHKDRWIGSGGYELRPEALEAIFYMWRRTREEKYRNWAWFIFQNIEKYCRTQYGYSTIANVRSKSPKKNNVMHSFFIAETLKYLYLIFSDDDILPLDKFVFNTEAHPLRIQPGLANPLLLPLEDSF